MVHATCMPDMSGLSCLAMNCVIWQHCYVGEGWVGGGVEDIRRYGYKVFWQERKRRRERERKEKTIGKE